MKLGVKFMKGIAAVVAGSAMVLVLCMWKPTGTEEERS